MNCPSESSSLKQAFRSRTAFTLVEGMAAAALLAFIGASVWMILERCSLSAADSTQRMRAFEIARDNMEKLLGSASVEEMTEYGISEKFPDIRWQTTVESFYESLSGRMWARAVCIAEYTDSAGETKSVELAHWLTDLTDEQTKQLTERKALREQLLARHIIETEELAAQYAGAGIETIEEWVKNGMPTFDGAYLKPWLDLYLQTNGSPTAQDKLDTISKFPELSPAPQKEVAPTPGLDTLKLPEDLDPELKEKLEQLLGSQQ